MAASVEFIEYNGKKYPIKLGIYSLMLLQKREGISLDDINSNPELYAPILFMALQQGSQITKEPLDLLEDEMTAVLDDCFVEFTTLLPKFFPEEMMEKLMEDGGMIQMKEPKKAPIKKKPIKKK